LDGLFYQAKCKQRFSPVEVDITFLAQSGQEEVKGIFDGEKVDECVAFLLITVGAAKIALVCQFDRKTGKFHLCDG
jgi:hypothetical protein